MSSQFVEAIKEFLRTGVLAAIVVVTAQLEAGGVIDWRPVVIATAIAVLRAVDKFLHELEVKSPLDLKPLDALKSE